MLKANGGSGTVNQHTGLLQFDEGSDGPNGANGNGNGTGGGTGGSNGANGTNGASSGKGSDAEEAGNAANVDAAANTGVDMGLGAVGPGRGGFINGPSVAGILGNIAAMAMGPAVSAANTLTGTVDDSGKTAASKAVGALGQMLGVDLSSPMGSVNFGGNPGETGPGASPFGGYSGTSTDGGLSGGGPSASNAGGGNGTDNGGGILGDPPGPSLPSQNSAQIAAQGLPPSIFHPWQYAPIGNPVHPLLQFGQLPFR
jgi:hypothetical protein